MTVGIIAETKEERQAKAGAGRTHGLFTRKFVANRCEPQEEGSMVWA